MKTKFNYNERLSLKKTLTQENRYAFSKNNKHYPQVF